MWYLEFWSPDRQLWVRGQDSFRHKFIWRELAEKAQSYAEYVQGRICRIV